MKKFDAKKFDAALAKPMTVLIKGKPVRVENFDDGLKKASEEIWKEMQAERSKK